MQQIFCTSDLLNEIFPYLSQDTRTVAARVCRLWFTHSIRFIWDTVSVDNILRVLSPFNNDGFQQPLSSESWSRFLLYSNNIRQLECSRIQYTALKQALLWRPNVDLFSSKLTVLYWDEPSEYIEYLPSLVTSSLQILQVRLDIINDPNTLDVLYQTILLRSPSLHSFELSFPSDETDTQAVSRPLAELFSLLSGIVSIRLPSHCMTGELFTTLSRLPQLQDLSLTQVLHYTYMDNDIMETLPKRKIEDDEEAKKDIPFRSLGKIVISDSDYMMAETLRRDIRLLKLVDLTYSSPSLDHTITFMESLHKICPNLKKITIFTPDGLPFQAIRSLLQCPALVDIVSRRGVDMELGDIITIAINRSSWQVIRLPSVKPLSYQALVVFAQNCPDLCELRLTLNSRLGIPDLNAFTTDVKFLSLTSLIVESWVSPDFEIAVFLSKICSKPVKISGYGGAEHPRFWRIIDELVNFVTTTQLEIRTLKDENTLLHAQKCFHDF